MTRRQNSPALFYLALACCALGLLTGRPLFVYLGLVLMLVFLWRLRRRPR